MVDPIYLDYQATTPLAPEVFEAMVPWLKDDFGNPHSAHILGRKAAAGVEVARDQVAALMPSGGNVIFTGSATEAINLAFGAIVESKNKRIICPASEHAAVLDTARFYAKHDIPLTNLFLNQNGSIDHSQLQSELKKGDVALAAAMLVNNEIGIIQNVASVAEEARNAGALTLCDAVQGYGRVLIPDNVDMVAISGHKIHGPKGIGALWVRDGIDLPPLIHGGGQEAGIRSGTLSPALCVGMGIAAKLAKDRMAADQEHVQKLSNLARHLFSDWTLNGDAEQRYHGNLNIRRDGLDVARLMSDVRGVAFSAGSACASGSGRPSHVLSALGLEPAQIKSSIRLGFGRYTTEAEIEKAAKLINEAVKAQDI